MGFGIALFGYAFLLLHEMGGALIGAPLLAYGFFLASRLERNFLKASVASVFMMPRGIVQFCSVSGLFDLESLAALNTVTFVLYLSAWMMSSFFWFNAVINISRSCNAQKLERQARNRLVITTMFITFTLSAGILNIAGLLGGYAFILSAIQYILQYAVIIINTLFMHTCFVLITSEKQYEKDKQMLAIERAKAIEKRHKEQQEVANRIEKNKK